MPDPWRFVHRFAEAPASDTALLGGKGAGLARMAQSGLPVPPGFIISTDAFREYHARGRRVPEQLMSEVWAAMEELESATGRRFGAGAGVPLLVSVRSGARISMPGMMDTILNLGLDAAGVTALAASSGDSGFAIDTCLRFWDMYARIVLGVDVILAEEVPDAVEAARAGDVRALERAVVAVIEREGGSVPGGPHEQLAGAIAAVFDSWGSRRAVAYRRHHGIPDDLGTAVVVQSMVFGNLGHPSGSGVAFTRDPRTGENRLYGEYLEGGQGEEVVAGSRTPARIDELRERRPELVGRLEEVAARLEEIYRDALDIEFTVEQGRLYLLQVRSAKRTARAAIRIAAELLRESRAPVAVALGMVSADEVRQTASPTFDEKAVTRARAGGALLGTGIGASPGHASGIAVLDPDRAAEMGAQGHSVILVRPTTSPLDVHGMIAASGIVTAVGGSTSHAAVVARALNKPCVVGCQGLRIDLEQRRFGVAERWLEEGAPISMDGASGALFGVGLPTVRAEASSSDLAELLSVADGAARCDVLGRATTVDQVRTVLESGARGVLIRLEDVLATLGTHEGLDEAIAGALAPLLEAAGDRGVLVPAGDVTWLEVRLPEDPRTAVDAATAQLILSLPEARRSEVGILLTGPVTEEIAGLAVGAGFRRFGVDTDEVRPARLAFGKAALVQRAT